MAPPSFRYFCDPGDNLGIGASLFLPGIIRKFVEAKERSAKSVILRGDGSPTRDVVGITDECIARMYFRAMRKPPDVVRGRSGEGTGVGEVI